MLHSFYVQEGWFTSMLKNETDQLTCTSSFNTGASYMISEKEHSHAENHCLQHHLTGWVSHRARQRCLSHVPNDGGCLRHVYCRTAAYSRLDSCWPCFLPVVQQFLAGGRQGPHLS